jgi:hypothetical protein
VEPSVAAAAEIPVAMQPSPAEASSHPAGQVAPEGSVPYAVPVSADIQPPPVDAAHVVGAPPSSFPAAQADPLAIVTDSGGSAGQGAGSAVDGGAKRRRRQNLAFGIGATVLVVVATGIAVFVLSRPAGHDDSSAGASSSEQHDPSSPKPKRRDINIPEVDELLGNESTNGTAGEPPSEQIDPAGAATPGDTWVDASKGVSVCGDMEVKVVKAEMRPLVLRSRGSSTAPEREGEHYLKIRLGLANNAKGQKQYIGWATRPASVELADNHGQVCQMKSFRNASTLGQQRQASIEPSGSIEDVLFFEEPAADADFLRLTLPGSAFGEQAAVKLQIPMSMVVVDTGTATTGGDADQDLASEPPTDPDHPRAPGRPLPEVERAIAEISAEQGAEATQSTAPMESEAETQPATETVEPKFGPIGIPGLHDEEAEEGDDKEVSGFEDDPELMKQREQMLRQRAEEREKQKRAGSSRGRSDRR